MYPACTGISADCARHNLLTLTAKEEKKKYLVSRCYGHMRVRTLALAKVPGIARTGQSSDSSTSLCMLPNLQIYILPLPRISLALSLASLPVASKCFFFSFLFNLLTLNYLTSFCDLIYTYYTSRYLLCGATITDAAATQMRARATKSVGPARAPNLISQFRVGGQ